VTKDLAAAFSQQLEDYTFCMVGEVYRITQIVESVYDGKGINLKEIIPPTEFPATGGSKVLDEVEKKLLAAISEDATLPIHKIAEKSGLTPEVVRYRLRKLKEDGTILRTTPTINYSALGLVEYIVKINLKSLTPEKEKRMKLRISHIPAIKYAYRTLGEQSVFVDMNTRSVDELESILKSIRTDFFDIIKSIKYHHVTQHQRFTLFPDVMKK
jgi:DNA-binding Lrp family transcriptional regulator